MAAIFGCISNDKSVGTLIIVVCIIIVMLVITFIDYHADKDEQYKHTKYYTSTPDSVNSINGLNSTIIKDDEISNSL